MIMFKAYCHSYISAAVNQEFMDFQMEGQENNNNMLALIFILVYICQVKSYLSLTSYPKRFSGAFGGSFTRLIPQFYDRVVGYQLLGNLCMRRLLLLCISSLFEDLHKESTSIFKYLVILKVLYT